MHIIQSNCVNILQNSPFFDLYEIDLKSGILGDGSFSICRRCVKKSTGKEYAVKIVSRKVDSSNEVALLRLCQGHENIVKLHNVYHDEVRFITWIDTVLPDCMYKFSHNVGFSNAYIFNHLGARLHCP